MRTSQISDVIQHLRGAVLLPDGARLTDGQLLEHYLSRHDEAALAALVRRHGPMVWAVCRRVLRNYHDAEDAFQATFLVLVRKGASISFPELLANWLYRVAHQTATKARATAARRGARERQVMEMPEPEVAQQELRRDLQLLLDQELNRLPDKYRMLIVLCDLVGKTRKEVAQQLGCPEGTVAGRLARARVMLAKRLSRHGVVLSGVALAAVLSQSAVSACVPTSVLSCTIKVASLFAAGQAAATGAISAKVAALTQGVLNTMLLTKLKVVAALLFVVGFSALAYGIMAQGQREVLATQREAVASQVAHKQTPKDEGPVRADPMPSSEDLKGKWTGEKNGVKVELTFTGNKAHWQVAFRASRKPKTPQQEPTVGVHRGADLKCAPDEKAGRLSLYLPAYLGDDKEIKNKYPILTGRAAVGEIKRGAEGTVQLRIIPTGYENLDQEDYDYPAVEGLILRRVAEPSK